MFEVVGCDEGEYQQFVARLLKGKILPEIDRELEKARVADCVAKMTMEQSKQVFEILEAESPGLNKQKALRTILKLD